MSVLRMLALCVLFGSTFNAVGEESNRPSFLIGVPDVLRESVRGSTLSQLEFSIRAAYKSIGIGVKFLRLPAKRLSYMTQSDSLDADIIRVEEFGTKYPNMLKVPIPLVSDEVYAVSLVSDNIDLNSESYPLYTATCLRGMVVTDVYCNAAKSKIEANSVEQLTLLLDNKRVQVAYIFSKILKRNELKGEQYKIHPSLVRFTAYHFINKKHESLLPELTRAFENEFTDID